MYQNKNAVSNLYATALLIFSINRYKEPSVRKPANALVVARPNFFIGSGHHRQPPAARRKHHGFLQRLGLPPVTPSSVGSPSVDPHYLCASRSCCSSETFTVTGPARRRRDPPLVGITAQSGCWWSRCRPSFRSAGGHYGTTPPPRAPTAPKARLHRATQTAAFCGALRTATRFPKFLRVASAPCSD